MKRQCRFPSQWKAPLGFLTTLFLALACSESPSNLAIAPPSSADSKFQESGPGPEKSLEGKNDIPATPTQGKPDASDPDLAEKERLKQQIAEIEQNQPDLLRRLSEIEVEALAKDDEMRRLSGSVDRLQTSIKDTSAEIRQQASRFSPSSELKKIRLSVKLICINRRLLSKKRSWRLSGTRKRNCKVNSPDYVKILVLKEVGPILAAQHPPILPSTAAHGSIRRPVAAETLGGEKSLCGFVPMVFAPNPCDKSLVRPRMRPSLIFKFNH